MSFRKPIDFLQQQRDLQSSLRRQRREEYMKERRFYLYSPTPPDPNPTASNSPTNSHLQEETNQNIQQQNSNQMTMENTNLQLQQYIQNIWNDNDEIVQQNIIEMIHYFRNSQIGYQMLNYNFFGRMLQLAQLNIDYKYLFVQLMNRISTIDSDELLQIYVSTGVFQYLVEIILSFTPKNLDVANNEIILYSLKVISEIMYDSLLIKNEFGKLETLKRLENVVYELFSFNFDYLASAFQNDKNKQNQQMMEMQGLNEIVTLYQKIGNTYAQVIVSFTRNNQTIPTMFISFVVQMLKLHMKNTDNEIKVFMVEILRHITQGNVQLILSCLQNKIMNNLFVAFINGNDMCQKEVLTLLDNWIHECPSTVMYCTDFISDIVEKISIFPPQLLETLYNFLSLCFDVNGDYYFSNKMNYNQNIIYIFNSTNEDSKFIRFTIQQLNNPYMSVVTTVIQFVSIIVGVSIKILTNKQQLNDDILTNYKGLIELYLNADLLNSLMCLLNKKCIMSSPSKLRMILETIYSLCTFSTHDNGATEKWKIIEMFIENKGNNILDTINEILSIKNRSSSPGINGNEVHEKECFELIKRIKEWIYLYECRYNQNDEMDLDSSSFDFSNSLNDSCNLHTSNYDFEF